jgi:hypothetical protein
MKRSNTKLVVILFTCLLTISFLPFSSGQDQVEIPSWEVGWETNMDGVYELQLSGEEDITDSIEFFVANDRMGDLNLEISIEWDESGNIPIELDYDESISVSASDNQTFTIEISDASGYSFERSPNDSMTLLLTAQEILLEQPLSTQEIDAELSVPAVFDLTLESESKDETLFAGSSVEYSLIVTNDGNTKDVIKMPESSIKSCPSVSVEGLDSMNDIEIENSTTKDFAIRISASESQPERLCEITISIKSAGNGKISSIVFEINVNSNSAENDDKGDSNVEESPDNDNSELTETNTLNFVMGYEIILMIMIALIFRSRN